MVVRKKDGGIRICGDFKVSINRVIKAQVYPLPTPEEMFSALANGESYTKLDLARAESPKRMPTSAHDQHASGTVPICKTPFWHHDSTIVVAEGDGPGSEWPFWSCLLYR